MATTNNSARAIINDALSKYGLTSLAQWAWNEYLHGASTEQIMLDLRDRPEYKQRFPAMEKLAQDGRAITEQQYIDYETAIVQTAKAAGLPAGMYDQPADFTTLLTNNVSATEFKDRVDMAKAQLYTAPPEQQAALNRLYDAGASQGQVLAFFINPTKAEPLIAKEYAASQVAGQAEISGYGQLSAQQAELVGSAQPTPDQLQQGFQQLVQEKQLFEDRLGAHADAQSQAIDARKQLSAAFLGDAEAQKEILRQQAERKAEFGATERFTEDKTGQGFTGIGRQPGS